MKIFATLVDEIEQELQDTDNATFLLPEVKMKLEDVLREVTEFVPYRRMVTFKLETRTGTADEDKASALVDDTNAQFLSTDVGKVIYNTDDKTWAIVTAYVDSGELTLSSDIFPDGNEAYKMFNSGCKNNKEINIEDVKDRVEIDKVEYPVGYYPAKYRNWELNGDILRLDIGFTPDDSADTDAEIEVDVYFDTIHRMFQPEDSVGTVNGDVAAGLKALTVAGIGAGTDEVAEWMLFTVAGVRGTYMVTADVTLSGGGGAIAFTPALEGAITDGTVITFIASTLDRLLERIAVGLTAAKCAISKSRIDSGGSRSPRDLQDWGERRERILLDLRRLVAPRTSQTWPRTR